MSLVSTIRTFGYRQKGGTVPLYGNEPTITELRSVFSYVFRKTQEGGGKPQVETHIVDGPLSCRVSKWFLFLFSTCVLPILGYRIGNMAYITDCSRIPAESLELLHDLELILRSGAL